MPEFQPFYTGRTGDSLVTAIDVGESLKDNVGTLADIGEIDDQLSFKGELIKGERGGQGEAATVEIGAVTTVEQGEPADVVNVGTPQNAIFNFKFPQGKPATINGFNNIEIVNGQNTTVEMDGNKLQINVADSDGGDGASPEWGNIVGEITNQIDLINYVDDIVGDIGAVLDAVNRVVI